MSSPSLEAKKAYYRKVRQSNYAASLRLEGFNTSPEDSDRELPSREELLKIYGKKSNADDR